MDSQIIHILTRIEGKLEQHDERFDAIVSRFDARFEGIDNRLDGIDRTLAHHTELHEQHRRDIADINAFMMKELNVVHGRLDRLDAAVGGVWVGLEGLQSDFRAFRDELAGQRERTDDHEQRIEELERRSA